MDVSFIQFYHTYSNEIKIILSSFVGAIVGLEREFRHKAAGVRTFAMLCLTSCLLTLLSVNAPGLHDVTRLTGQIITGVGFLCGAVIWKKDNSSIEGLTTAASLFCISAIGVCIGYGFEKLALFSVFMVFIIIEVFSIIQKKVIKTIKNSRLTKFINNDQEIL